MAIPPNRYRPFSVATVHFGVWVASIGLCGAARWDVEQTRHGHLLSATVRATVQKCKYTFSTRLRSGEIYDFAADQLLQVHLGLMAGTNELASWYA